MIQVLLKQLNVKIVMILAVLMWSMSSFSTVQAQPRIASAKMQYESKVDICNYSFDSKIYKSQQQWTDEYDRIKQMDFFYLQVPQITVWYQKDEQKPEQMKLPIEVLVNSNYTVWGIKLLKS